MDQIDRLSALGLLDARVPRYTSYPTAPVFTPATGAAFQESCFAALDPDVPVSVYVHIPFCERLCWFCACRTQGTRTHAPVARYVDTLLQELALVRDRAPDGLKLSRLHFGGGTPTILTPDLIHRLTGAIRDTFGWTDGSEFSVEIDPTLVDEDKIAALAEGGMTRASIGIQDFAPKVQAAIGRPQSPEETRFAVDALRAAGIGSLNADLVYGLPFQTEETLRETLDQVCALRPDRIALYGYAHVPHMSKRQALIDAATLPDDVARYHLAQEAARHFVAAGFQTIGIDHFARPWDGLAEAKATGRLHRNFQGYTDDQSPVLIGLGASSISRYPQGYVQNAPATGAYTAAIEAGALPGVRGHAFTGEDRLRARAIELLMCTFTIDPGALLQEFGDAADALQAVHDRACTTFAPFVVPGPDGRGIRLLPEGRPLARMVARLYDAYATEDAQFSKAS